MTSSLGANMVFIHEDVNATGIEAPWGQGFFFTALSPGPRTVLGPEQAISQHLMNEHPL